MKIVASPVCDSTMSVAASRSVIFAYDEPKYKTRKDDWKGCIRDACVDFIQSVNSVIRS